MASHRKGILIRRPEHLRVASDYKCSRGILIRRPASTSTAELQVGGALTRGQAKRAKLEVGQNSSLQKVDEDVNVIQPGDDAQIGAEHQVTML